jgi:hypothetical protein
MDYIPRSNDPYTNRFIQPDSIIPNPANPQSWNRFSYVLNSPIRYKDPSGHIECEEVDANGRCISLTTADYKEFYKNKVKDDYDWEIQGDLALDELKTIYQAGRDIEISVNHRLR